MAQCHFLCFIIRHGYFSDTITINNGQKFSTTEIIPKTARVFVVIQMS